MGGCSKTLKFVITIITWWVSVTKKWNCPLLFVTNLWCLQFFCKNVTSQARKGLLFFFQPKAIAKGLLILDNCGTKKCFSVLHNNIVVLTKRKETSDQLFWPRLFVFCFLHFGTLKKTTQKSAVSFSKSKCSLFCFWL